MWQKKPTNNRLGMDALKRLSSIVIEGMLTAKNQFAKIKLAKNK